MPANEGYPFMLELFSRVPDALSVADDSRLTPIPLDAELSSLSAILLEGDYYDFIGFACNMSFLHTGGKTFHGRARWTRLR